MPNEIVAHGDEKVSPQLDVSVPAAATKMPFVMSPSMPSQLSSV